MSHEEAEGFPVRQEEDTVPSGRLVKIALGTLGVGLLGVVFAAVLLETNTGGIRARDSGAGPPRSAGTTIARIEQTPILGPAAGLDLKRAQRAELSRYRWVDRDAGVAGIPIERAMDLLVEQSR